MNIIIEYGVTKRRINGPFNICGSGKDLIRVADAILAKVQGQNGYYGWVEVTYPVPSQPSIPNTEPSDWDS